MTENGSAHPFIPVLTNTEEQLAKIRRQLEGMFTELRLVQDVLIVCGEACKSENTFVEDKVEHILRCASDRLYRVMKTLTDVVERFGGTTDMSREADHARAAFAVCR